MTKVRKVPEKPIGLGSAIRPDSPVSKRGLPFAMMRPASDIDSSVVAIIPARYASTRLPGKLLLAETGWPLIRHAYETARRSNRVRRVIVATDDLRIAEAVAGFGGEVVLTRTDHPSGTDRVAEVAAALPGARIVVNLQGDEPEISAPALDHVVDLLEDDLNATMATLAAPIRDEAIYRDPACVKVVVSASGRALYFSRSPIPYYRADPADSLGLLHLGVYAYRRDFLCSLSNLAPSPLERIEQLEQLRVLEAGYSIAVSVISEPSIGINTLEDYRRFVIRCQSDSARSAGLVAERE
jgi:3-deoxy-manno-octulosonate cytidylyltransferase (CMP-KDO synthetase)